MPHFLELERRILLHTADPLCLDPSVNVSLVLNAVNYNRGKAHVPLRRRHAAPPATFPPPPTTFPTWKPKEKFMPKFALLSFLEQKRAENPDTFPDSSRLLVLGAVNNAMSASNVTSAAPAAASAGGSVANVSAAEPAKKSAPRRAQYSEVASVRGFPILPTYAQTEISLLRRTRSRVLRYESAELKVAITAEFFRVAGSPTPRTSNEVVLRIARQGDHGGSSGDAMRFFVGDELSASQYAVKLEDRLVKYEGFVCKQDSALKEGGGAAGGAAHIQVHGAQAQAQAAAAAAAAAAQMRKGPAMGAPAAAAAAAAGMKGRPGQMPPHAAAAAQGKPMMGGAIPAGRMPKGAAPQQQQLAHAQEMQMAAGRPAAGMMQAPSPGRPSMLGMAAATQIYGARPAAGAAQAAARPGMHAMQQGDAAAAAATVNPMALMGRPGAYPAQQQQQQRPVGGMVSARMMLVNQMQQQQQQQAAAAAQAGGRPGMAQQQQQMTQQQMTQMQMQHQQQQMAVRAAAAQAAGSPRPAGQQQQQQRQ